MSAQRAPTRIVVEEATGPRPTDTRARTRYQPDRVTEQREIDERHRIGLHYVGDWHTHPEAIPTLSSLDIASISETVRRSTHSLNGFVLVVVGSSEPPDGLSVSVHDRFGDFTRLHHEAITRVSLGDPETNF